MQENFFTLMLSFPFVDEEIGDFIDLGSMISSNLKGESIELKCKVCKTKENFEKKTEISQFPEYLILSPARFQTKGGMMKKNFTKILYPLELELPSSSTLQQCLPTKYKLQTVIVHSGKQLDFGHYICYARANNIQSKYSTVSDDWYLFNDTRVSQVKFEDFAEQCQEYVTSDRACALIYRNTAESNETIGHAGLRTGMEHMPRNVSGLMEPTKEVNSGLNSS